MGQITANAMAWAGFRSAGGIRKSMLASIGYATVVVGIILMVVVANPNQRQVFDAAPRFLLGAQIAIMGLFVCASILNTIQKDTTSKMLESHRLMPIAPRLAVLGYAGGAAAPTLLLALFNFIAGGILAGMGGLPLSWWIAANAVVLTFCAFLWCITAGAALYGVPAVMICGVPIGIVVISGGAAGMAIPPLLMLSSPILGPSIFQASVLTGDDMMLWITSAALQIAVAWAFVEMGARRFRSADLPPISAGWGVALLALFAAGGAMAVNHESLAVNIRRPEYPLMTTATCIFLLITAAAIIGSVIVEERVVRPGRPLHMLDGKSVWLVGGTVVIATAFGASVRDVEMQRVVWTAGAFLVSTLLLQAWAKWLLPRGGVAAFVVGILAVSIVPMLASLLFLDFSVERLSPAGRVVSQVSPLSMLSAIWSDRTVTAEPAALVIQAAIAVTGMVLVWRGSRGILTPMIKPVAD